MIAVLVDEDFNAHIIAGLIRRQPDFSFERVVEVGLAGRPDPDALEWASERGLVIATQDARTFPRHAYQRLEAGKCMPGVIVVPQSMPIGTAITELELLLVAVSAEEIDRRVLRLPL